MTRQTRHVARKGLIFIKQPKKYHDKRVLDNKKYIMPKCCVLGFRFPINLELISRVEVAGEKRVCESVMN